MRARLGAGRRESEVRVGGDAADRAALDERAGDDVPAEAAREAGVG